MRLIAANPLRGKLDLPEGGSRGGEAVWTPKIFKIVTENVNDRFADFLRALAWTGARPSTVRKIEARHYRPHLKVWDVEDIYRGRKSNRKTVRRIWLNPQMVKLVERLNKEHPEGPIFVQHQGPQVQRRCRHDDAVQAEAAAQESKAAVLLPEGLTVYGLRHTFATQFIVQHPDKLEYLRELLGHKDLKMIRKHYGHLFDESAALHGVLSDLKTL